jgi:hypothetical protein
MVELYLHSPTRLRGNELSGSIKCWEVVGVAAQLAASQEGLSSMSERVSE